MCKYFRTSFSTNAETGVFLMDFLRFGYTARAVSVCYDSRGMSGKHTSNHCIYGYKKDPNDKDHWIIDEEAAEVVRRIYRMAIEGKGPYEIARILATEKIERPSYYLAQRGMGNHQSNYNAADPYTWRGGTVAEILSLIHI